MPSNDCLYILLVGALNNKSLEFHGNICYEMLLFTNVSSIKPHSGWIHINRLTEILGMMVLVIWFSTMNQTSGKWNRRFNVDSNRSVFFFLFWFPIQWSGFSFASNKNKINDINAKNAGTNINFLLVIYTYIFQACIDREFCQTISKCIVFKKKKFVRSFFHLFEYLTEKLRDWISATILNS